MNSTYIYPAGVVYQDIFFFVFDRKLRAVKKGTGPIFWDNITTLNSPPSEQLQERDSISLLNNSLFTVSESGRLLQYNLQSQTWSNHHVPNNNVKCFSPTGATMYGNSLFIVGIEGRWKRELYQFTINNQGKGNWTHHGRPNNTNLSGYDIPMTLSDGNLFLTDKRGRLVQRYISSNGAWVWGIHGKPPLKPITISRVVKGFLLGVLMALLGAIIGFLVGGIAGAIAGAIIGFTVGFLVATIVILIFRATNAAAAGGAMFGNKLFISGEKGHVYQFYWASNQWNWFNHGKLFSYSPALQDQGIPFAINNDEVFVTHFTNDTDTNRIFWDGNNWMVEKHYSPQSGIVKHKIASGAGGVARNPDTVFVLTEVPSGIFYLSNLYKSGTTWKWSVGVRIS